MRITSEAAHTTGDHARRRASRILWATVAVSLSWHAPGWTQSRDEARQQLERVEEALREKRALEQGLTSDITAIEAERERLNQNLLDTAARIQESETQLTRIEERLGELETQEALLRGSLAERHGTITRLLGAMQRMGRDPPPVMITRREDALVMVRSAMMLASAFPQLKTQAMELAGRLNELARVMGESRSESERLRVETQQLTESRVRMSTLIEEKRNSLAERQDALDRVRREAAEISRNVTDLNELIARLDSLVAREMGVAAAAPAPVAPPSGAPAPMTPPPVAVSPPGTPLGAAASRPVEPEAPAVAMQDRGGEPAAVLAPKGTRFASLNAGRIRPAMPFAEAKGRLPLPVAGRRILDFGARAHASRSSGIVIETRAGAQVVSPLDGWIVFAGVFRSYGQILIINGGDGYHMLLAGLSQIDVQLGQFVLAGEPVGLMSGGPQGAGGRPPAGAPVLYVELRKDGRPINPDPWWAGEGTKKVQG